MKIKRYFAPDIRQAIGKVREELGPDAVILSNQPVEGGVEIVAAIDYDERLLRDSPEGRKSPGRDGARPQIEWAQDPALSDMRREIKSMRGLLEQQLTNLAFSQAARKHPLKTRLFQALRELGLNPPVSQDIVRRLPETGDFDALWQQALALLARALPVTDDDILSHGGVVALVGPTGVGKTTTIAKLAARFVLRHGQQNVALVTTDNYRIAAHEQLRTYGRILGLPVRAAADANELRAVLTGFKDRRLVLIDTAGMSQRDVRLTEQFAALTAGIEAIKTYLVLSATTQASGLVEVVRAFRAVRLNGCILTKLDEAAGLGGVLSIVLQHHLPVAYVSDGQRVPEDMRPARAPGLVSRSVALMHRTGQMLKNQQPRVSGG